MIHAIDPGTEKSAVLTLIGTGAGSISGPRIMPNDQLLQFARNGYWSNGSVAIEMIASYGMPVGRETFETVLLIGQLMEAFHRNMVPVRLVYRKDIKIHLCGTMKAKDANVRHALLDKYGPQGTKKKPGPTYGISKDLWSALAIADYAQDTQQPHAH